ncbi:hypothetical protein DW261_04030 [Fusobacterium varium]|uniref:hypothetical protein n=1 Tax=Fusobacterium varium TaxID=856 RepID=UPI000E50481E|nr:hypothetical protein [Fusobacterium varium]RHG37066.1 hypothetical protein DW261_04030 [Fusobacterium varium]
MNIKKIGNDKTYIEYNPVVNFGTRIGIKKIGESTFVIDEKEKTIKYGRQSFEESLECFVLCKQITKIVENGIVVFEGKGNLSTETLGKAEYNLFNLQKAFDEIIKSLPTALEEETEKK